MRRCNVSIHTTEDYFKIIETFVESKFKTYASFAKPQNMIQ